MAETQSHFSFSIIIASAYAMAGIFLFYLYPEHVLLASVIVIITGMLPDIDSRGLPHSKELAGVLAAIAPLVVIAYFPEIEDGGVARIALVVICCYLLSRVLIVRALDRYTSDRGIAHSIPAAILAFEVTYLMFWDLFWFDRFYLGFAAFVGYFSHLLLDAYGNLDLVGSAMGKAKKKTPVIKLGGSTRGSTIMMYCSVIVLGWFVLTDIYPSLSVVAAVRY